MTLPILLLVLAAILVWLFGWAGRRRPSEVATDDDIDREELEAADEELRDLDSFATPDDAEELPDWGPGAPT